MTSELSPAEKALALAEALPHIRRHHGRTLVVKYGGNAMGGARDSFARDVALLKLVGANPVVVHGGGPQISRLLARVGKQSRFVQGMRHTDGETMEIAQMALGLVNQQIVRAVNAQGGRAVGITGKDGGLIRARRMKLRGKNKNIDLGLVGEVESVSPAILSHLESADFVPVVAPVGADAKGEALNINADLVAAHLAVALRAEALLLLTNTDGILDKKGKLIPQLSAARARRLIREGVIEGGMRPKVECALAAVKGGVQSCRVVNGSREHSLLLELFTDRGAGTLIAQ